jgi:hypothetical protein
MISSCDAPEKKHRYCCCQGCDALALVLTVSNIYLPANVLSNVAVQPRKVAAEKRIAGRSRAQTAQRASEKTSDTSFLGTETLLSRRSTIKKYLIKNHWRLSASYML